LKFAIYKSSDDIHTPAGSVRGRMHVALDAMKSLSEVRTLDFIHLKSQLKEQAIFYKHHQVGSN
ncbi:TPA: F-box protein, partial [Legionella pneumophila]